MSEDTDKILICPDPNPFSLTQTDNFRAAKSWHFEVKLQLDILTFRFLASVTRLLRGKGASELMKVKTICVLISTFWVFLLVTGMGWAQVVQSPNAPGATSRWENAISLAGKYQNYVYGVVKKIDKNKLILNKTRFGNDQVFMLEHGTKFVHNGKRSKLAQLKVGDMVWVDAKLNKKKHERIARKVITGIGPKGVSNKPY